MILESESSLSQRVLRVRSVLGGLQRRSVAGLAACAFCTGFAFGADQVSVSAARHGSAVAVQARATLGAPLEVIWGALTDYDNLSKFIPGIDKSRVTTRTGSTVTVEQTGYASFLIFDYPIQVLVSSEEQYPSAIRVRLLSGNLRQLDGAYRIESVEGRNDRYVLHWSGIIEPDTVLPLFITVPLMRTNVRDQFLAMIREIERRERARGHTG